jgi:poly-gamma-glutamate synthesis protein (capsule biosynthesis protein)
VHALDATVDVVVLSLHWGREFTEAPTAGQIALAHRLVDAGADVIIGHHPHVLQSVELYRDRPIVYSLGNFVFGHQPAPRDLSALLELSLQRGAHPIARVALRPVRLLGPLGTPTVVDGALARPVLARVRDASARFRTVFSERDGALEVQLTPAR